MLTSLQEQNTLRKAKPAPAHLHENEAAFKKMYDQYHQRLYAAALRFLKSKMQAQEVVQEVFLKLWLRQNPADTKELIEAWFFTEAKTSTLMRLKSIAMISKPEKRVQQGIMNNLRQHDFAVSNYSHY